MDRKLPDEVAQAAGIVLGYMGVPMISDTPAFNRGYQKAISLREDRLIAERQLLLTRHPRHRPCYDALQRLVAEDSSLLPSGKKLLPLGERGGDLSKYFR